MERTGEHGLFLLNDIDVNLRHIQRRIVVVEQQIERVISRATELTRQVAQLKSITGIADKTGPRILAELSGLPKDMSARQWVAYAGLGPKPFESGSTVKPRGISKQGNRYLKDALYFPALVASQHEIWAMFKTTKIGNRKNSIECGKYRLISKRASNKLIAAGLTIY